MSMKFPQDSLDFIYATSLLTNFGSVLSLIHLSLNHIFLCFRYFLLLMQIACLSLHGYMRDPTGDFVFMDSDHKFVILCLIRCENINWAKRNKCNICNTSKPGLNEGGVR